MMSDRSKQTIAEITVAAENIVALREQAEVMRNRAAELDRMADELEDFSQEICLSAETL